jgi:hypothetical protein
VTDSAPPRSGFAAEVIARNASAGRVPFADGLAPFRVPDWLRTIAQPTTAEVDAMIDQWQRKYGEPAMTKDITIQGKDRTIAAQLFDQIRGIDTQAANDIQDWFEARYTLTPIDRPNDVLIADLIARSERQSSGPLEGAALFVELLASRGFEIRRITDAPPLAPIAPRDGSYDVTIGEIVQSSAITGKDHDDAYVGAHLRGQLAVEGLVIAVRDGGE